MILYHGGFSAISEPKILKPSRAMDFGQGFLSKTQLLEELMTWKFDNQFCFHTEKSLAFIKFVKSVEVR